MRVSRPTKAPFPKNLIREPLDLVNRSVAKQASAFDPKIEGYLDYIVASAGKRLRPALVLLTGGATGGWTEGHVRLGTILELIHIATLVHDDIIDGAESRRNQATANARWGNSMSVLLGDALFSHALTEATEFDSIHICRRIGQAAREVCSGEVMQTQRRFDLTLDKAEYFRLIEMKTGALFAVGSELASFLNGGSQSQQENLRQFGLKLGTAYQIYDDIVDLVGDEGHIGKTLGTDLEKGKLTLPILNLLGTATPTQRAKLNRLLIEKEPIDPSVLANIADYEGAIGAAVETAFSILEEARGQLIGLDETDYKAALLSLTSFLESLLERCEI